jgi:Type II transport protein GspH
MLLMAALTTVTASRFASREPFATQAVADQITSGLRLAQAFAVARRQTVHVQFTASPPALAVCLDSGCSQPLPPPGGGSWLSDTDGLSLAGASSFTFDASGAPSIATAMTLELSASGAAARSVRIEPGSGHVSQP